MKAILIFVSILFSQLLYGQTIKSKNLEQLFKERNFFELRDNYGKVKLTEAKRAYYRAFILNAFNDCETSVKVVNQITSKHNSELDSNAIAALLTLQVDNYVKIYQYSKAAAIGEHLIIQYGRTVDTVKLADLKNSNSIWNALRMVPPQTVSVKRNATINWNRDVAGLINIPVTVDNQTERFIFDTGANISTISESYAKKLNLQLIRSSFSVGSSTSISNTATLGVAPVLKIGDVLLQNVVFIVLPDDQLKFPQINYQINGIIGYPVISQLGEVHIKKNGTILIPRKQTDLKLRNLAMDELSPVIMLKTGGTALPFIFDTGAKQTELSERYFQKFKESIIKNGKLDSVKRGGAGGMVSYQVYTIPKLQLNVANKTATLSNIAVTTATSTSKVDFYYGNIGQDLIAKFGEMIINFKKMYISFK